MTTIRAAALWIAGALAAAVVLSPNAAAAEVATSATRAVTPRVSSAKVTDMDSFDATLQVRASAGVDQYTIVDDYAALSEADLDWIDITDPVETTLSTTFDAEVSLTPGIGTHPVLIAVQNSTDAVPSAVYTSKVTIATPRVYSGRVVDKTEQLAQVVKISTTAGVDEFAIVDKDETLGADAADIPWEPITDASYKSGRLTFESPVDLVPEGGRHNVYIAARMSTLGDESPIYRTTATVTAPRVSTFKLIALNGLDATFSVSATLGVDEYAVAEGDYKTFDPNTAAWQAVGDHTDTSTRTSFEITTTLASDTLVHYVYIAVRKSSEGISSAAKSTRVTVAAPKVTRASQDKGGDSVLAVTFTVQATPVCDEYRIVDGDSTFGEASASAASVAWLPIVATSADSKKVVFTAPVTLTRLDGTHYVYVQTRSTLLDGSPESAVYRARTRVTGPKVSRVKATALNGLDATLQVSATSGVDEYAVGEGDYKTFDPEAAVWLPITGADDNGRTSTFDVVTTLTSDTLVHNVYVAVRDAVDQISSAAKSTRITIAAPKVTRATLDKGGDSILAVTFTVQATPVCDEYRIVDGDSTFGEASASAASVAWLPIVATSGDSKKVVFTAPVTLTTAVGTHYVYVQTRSTLLDGSPESAVYRATTRVVGPSVKGLKFINFVGDLVGNFTATASSGVDEYAVGEGDYRSFDQSTATWLPIVDPVDNGKTTVFNFEYELNSGDPRVHNVYVAVRNSADQIASAAKSTRVTVKEPSVTSIRLTDLQGLEATFLVTASPGVSSFAIADGDPTAGVTTATSVWQDITYLTNTTTRVTFEATLTLEPNTGVHMVYIRVKHGDFTDPSAAKSVKVTVNGPKVLSASKRSLDTLTLTVGVNADGSPNQYTYVDGDWDPDTAVWHDLPGDTTVSGTRRSFTFTFALNPYAGAHQVYVAVRNLPLTSPAYSVSGVTVIGPTITNFSTSVGKPGDTFTINGTHFGTSAGSVTFSGTDAASLGTWADTSIQSVEVPYLPPGNYSVVVTDTSGLSSPARTFAIDAAWKGDWVGTWQEDVTAPTTATVGDTVNEGYVIASFIPGSGATFTGSIFPFTDFAGATTDTTMDTLHATGTLATGEVYEFSATYDEELALLVGWIDIGEGEAKVRYTVIFERPDYTNAGKLNGTYVLNYEPVDPTVDFYEIFGLFKFTLASNGVDLTAVDQLTSETYTGKLMGDVMVLVHSTATTYREINCRTGQLNDSGYVAVMVGTLVREKLDTDTWVDDLSVGFVADLTDGSAGISTAINTDTTWTFDFFTTGHSFDSPLDGYPGRVTISGNNITITVTVGATTRAFTGKIYGDSEFEQGYFIVSWTSGNTTIRLWGDLTYSFLEASTYDGIMFGTIQVYTDGVVTDVGTMDGLNQPF